MEPVRKKGAIVMAPSVHWFVRGHFLAGPHFPNVVHLQNQIRSFVGKMFRGSLINRRVTKVILGRKFGLFKRTRVLHTVFKKLYFDFRTWGLMLHPQKNVLSWVSKILFFLGDPTLYYESRQKGSDFWPGASNGRQIVKKSAGRIVYITPLADQKAWGPVPR
jgi:hypothetical protein